MAGKEKKEEETAKEYWHKLSDKEKEFEEKIMEYRRKVSEEEEREEKQKKEEREKGVFYIRLKSGAMASHLVKIKGVFKVKWNKWQIERYIKAKIDKEIDPYWEAEVELFKAEDDKVEVWVFIATVGHSETVKEWANEWLEHHITQSPDEIERGIAEIKSVEVEPVSPLSRMMNGA